MESKLSLEDKELISSVYVIDLRTVFISYAILAAALFISTLLIYDHGLESKVEEQSDGINPSDFNSNQ